MFKRIATQEIEEALCHQAAVAIIGPRQIGKTTLAIQEIGEKSDAVYLDLEDINDRNRLQNPVLYFENIGNRLVILDEIHRMPEIFQSLRGIIDKARRKGEGIGRFLILGSASIELLHQSSESLAGRISYIEMTGLNVLEIADSQAAREVLWLRGGFPQTFLAENDKISYNWRRDFVKTYLERDVAMFGVRVPSETLHRLWIMLAHNQGTLLNASKLGRDLQISTQSATRYIDLLCDLLLIRRLLPFHTNIKKRMVKSPKTYVRDSGLVHALLGIDSWHSLSGHPIIGSSWEGFVIENIVSVCYDGTKPYFYRTLAGAEIDLILQRPNGEIWAIEIKRNLTPAVSRGFHLACEDLKPSRAFVVYAGSETYPISASLTAISLLDIVKLLSQ